jgi:hypothetical protein
MLFREKSSMMQFLIRKITSMLGMLLQKEDKVEINKKKRTKIEIKRK